MQGQGAECLAHLWRLARQTTMTCQSLQSMRELELRRCINSTFSLFIQLRARFIPDQRRTCASLLGCVLQVTSRYAMSCLLPKPKEALIVVSIGAIGAIGTIMRQRPKTGDTNETHR